MSRLAQPVQLETTGGLEGYTCFGIPVASCLAFPGAWRASAPHADATFLVVEELPPWSDTVDGGWEGMSDGKTFTVQRSQTGEYRFSYGGRTLFHLSADHRTLTSAADEARDLSWWRILLDPVLFTVSLVRGMEALHAGAIATESGAVAIAATSGGGKSTLLSQLLREGLELVTDDILGLAAEDDAVLAYPGAPLMTLPRKRSAGVGAPLGKLGEEVWSAVPVVSDPLPLRHIVLLDRRPGARTGMYRVEHPLAPLMTHLLRFPPTRERELARFSLASAVAIQADIWELSADVNTSPEQLAGLILQELRL